MKKNIIIIIAIVLIAVVIRMVVTNYSNMMRFKSRMHQKAPSVVVEQVQQTKIKQSFEAPGRIVSKYQVGVVARIAGYLQKSYFQEGDSVRKGEALFLIEPNEYRNSSSMASASVRNIRAQLVYAEKQLVRSRELVKKDYIAKAKYDEVLANRDALRAQLASAQAQLADANRNLGYTVVKSPVNGRIGMITVTVGNYVTPSSGNLTTINSNDPIYVTFPLNSEDFMALEAADKGSKDDRVAEIIYQDGNKYEFSGVQNFHDNKVDPATGTVTMRATFKNPKGELIHGEFVTVRLHSNNPVVMPVVPQAAVQENQEGKYVYKLDGKGLPQLVYIKTSGQDGHNWIVKSGLNVGDKIITDGIQKVIPNSPINAVTKEQMAKLKKHDLAVPTKKKGLFHFGK
ncbi:MAG: efflux RND transporter periplasmic adaptor subunit [Clostridiaceae bacterium]|jgi:membrane fusion protein, multidrug efflux system|nr:efflux RND transporter periplasmic adaptor subunit [Clostridiaceae bacterium]